MKRVLSGLMVILTLMSVLVFSASAAGENIASAVPIEFGRTYTGVLSRTCANCYYQFTLPKPGRITCRIQSTEVTALYVSVYNGSGKSYSRTDCVLNEVTGRADKTESFYFTAGTFFLRVERTSPYNGQFSVSVQYEDMNESFCETETVRNDVLSDAYAIALGQNYVGQVGHNDLCDFYKFEVTEAVSIPVTVTSDMGSLILDCYDGSANRMKRLILVSNPATGKIDSTETIAFLQPGVYYLCFRVNHRDWTGAYSFKVGRVSGVAVRIEGEPAVQIRNYTKMRTEAYRTTVTFTAQTQFAPEGASIHWLLDGKDCATGEAFTVREARKDYSVQAVLVNASGVVIAQSGTETVHIDSSFFSILLSIIRLMFGGMRNIVQEIA